MLKRSCARTPALTGHRSAQASPRRRPRPRESAASSEQRDALFLELDRLTWNNFIFNLNACQTQ
jgi:hypothetical protein